MSAAGFYFSSLTSAMQGRARAATLVAAQFDCVTGPCGPGPIRSRPKKNPPVGGRSGRIGSEAELAPGTADLHRVPRFATRRREPAAIQRVGRTLQQAAWPGQSLRVWPPGPGAAPQARPFRRPSEASLHGHRHVGLAGKTGCRPGSAFTAAFDSSGFLPFD